MTFRQLEIIDPILQALDQAGYKEPTEIQAKVIPILLGGRDILASSQTGTGKTAAYTIPLIQRLATSEPEISSKRRTLRGLILSPTRELAAQIGDNLSNYSKGLKLKRTIIFGGVPQARQTNSMKNGVDIIVATPGRLIDLCNQGLVDLSQIEVLILDEADQMLDMGFLPDMKKIIRKCSSRQQTMMFSATIPPKIITLSNEICRNPQRIAITPVNEPIDKINQSVYKIEGGDKKKLLLHLLANPHYESVLVFLRTKYAADRIGKLLDKKGITNEVIHGNKSQNARTRALDRFKNGRSRILLATDIVARGIDVKNLSLVINYDLPRQTEVYLHRMGRTGRAGFDGKVISFCSHEERVLLRDIQRYIGMTIPEKSISKVDFADIEIEPRRNIQAGHKEIVDNNTRQARGVYKNKSVHFSNREFEVKSDDTFRSRRNKSSRSGGRSDSRKRYESRDERSHSSKHKSYRDFGGSRPASKSRATRSGSFSGGSSRKPSSFNRSRGHTSTNRGK